MRINNRGQVLGDYEDARGGCHGFLWYKGRLTTIDVPGAPTQAIGLDDRGRVAGTYIDAGGAFHGFLYDRGTYTTIDVPGALRPASGTTMPAGRSSATTRIPPVRLAPSSEGHRAR